MSTLDEIEAAVDALPLADQEQLMVFLAGRLRARAGELPPSRRFTPEEMNAWIAEDEADMQRLSRRGPDSGGTPT
jgi:hypothetical protein